MIDRDRNPFRRRGLGLKAVIGAAMLFSTAGLALDVKSCELDSDSLKIDQQIPAIIGQPQATAKHKLAIADAELATAQANHRFAKAGEVLAADGEHIADGDAGILSLYKTLGDERQLVRRADQLIATDDHEIDLIGGDTLALKDQFHGHIEAIVSLEENNITRILGSISLEQGPGIINIGAMQ